MKQKELMQAFEANQLGEAKAILCLYGSIVKLTDWEDANSIFCRDYLISHQGIVWDIRMKNGEVMSVGYNVA